MAGDCATPTADAPHLAGRRGNAEHLDTSVFAFERAGQGGRSRRQPKLRERSGEISFERENREAFTAREATNLPKY